jgi:hypothetical protein
MRIDGGWRQRQRRFNRFRFFGRFFFGLLLLGRDALASSSMTS